jgi:hypothetical protein
MALWEIPIYVPSVQTPDKLHLVGRYGYPNSVLSDSDTKKVVRTGKLFEV